ncbi:MAG: helicase-associated domain-containing protein [Dehalococcoidia bacterium]
MSSEQQIRQFLESYFAFYHASFLDQIAREVGLTFQSKRRNEELAAFLSEYGRVRALYQSCTSEEQRELTLHYLAGWQEEMGFYYGFHSRKSRTGNKEATLGLLRKGLLFMLPFYRGEKINPPNDISGLSGLRKRLIHHPLVEPLIRKEGSRWLPLNPIGKPERVHQIPYRHREQDLYRLAERIQREPLSLTNKGLPHRQELKRVAKEFSLPKDVLEKLSLLGMATELFYPTMLGLEVSKAREGFFKLTTEERLQGLGRSLPEFLELMDMLNHRFETEPVALILRLLGLVPPGEWYDLQTLVSWVKEQELLPHIYYGARDYFSETLEYTLSFIGWAELGYQGKNLVAFRITPYGGVALGNTDYLPPQFVESEGRLTVQPNFELLASIQSMSLQDAGFLEKFAIRTKGDVVNVYQLSQSSLYQAAQDSVTLEEVLKFIEDRSAIGIPDNVLHSLSDWWADFQRITIMEDVDLLENEGEFSFLQGDVPGLPVLDYSGLFSRIASWEKGQIRPQGEIDVFALEAFKAIAKPAGKSFRLDAERLRCLRNCSEAYLSRLQDVLSRALGDIPYELLLTLRAYHGEFGQANSTQLPVIAFPDPEAIQWLLQIHWFRNALVAWTGGLAILHPEKASEVKENLLSMGFGIGEGSMVDVAALQQASQAPYFSSSFATPPSQSDKDIRKVMQAGSRRRGYRRGRR